MNHNVDLTVLAHRIADDGPGIHTEALVRLASLAAARGLVPGAVEAIRDPRSATVVKQRAFARIAATLGRPLDRRHAA